MYILSRRAQESAIPRFRSVRFGFGRLWFVPVPVTVFLNPKIGFQSKSRFFDAIFSLKDLDIFHKHVICS